MEIFPSLYGLERIKHDSLYGPPKEIFDEKNYLAKKARERKHESESEDSEDLRDAYLKEQEDDAAAYN